MKLLKTLLAGVMAMALGSGVQAAQVSTTMSVTGNVIGEMTITTGNHNFGDKTKIVFNSQASEDHVFTTFCTEGMTCTIYPDTPGSPAWNLDGGASRNISTTGKVVKIKWFRDDGVTPWTPTSGWTFLGTGTDQSFTGKVRLEVVDTGLGGVNASFSPTIAN